MRIELGDLLFGGSEAGGETFDLAEPALSFSFRDPVGQVFADLDEPRPLDRGKLVGWALDHLRSLDRVGVMTGNRGRWPKIDGERGVEGVTLLILEWLGEQGVNAMIRMDAERLADNAPAWTFAASGGPLVHGIRADGRTVQQSMSIALARLCDAGLSVPF